MDSSKGTTGAVMRARECAGKGKGHPRSKAAHAGSPWITALIESLSDVPWSRVILLPKQLLSSVVYSHLFHPVEPKLQTPASTLHTLPLLSLLPCPDFRHDRTISRYRAYLPAFGPKFTLVSRSILSTNDDFVIRSI